MRGFVTGVGAKADIGAPPLTQFSFMSTRPRAAIFRFFLDRFKNTMDKLTGGAGGARFAHEAHGCTLFSSALVDYPRRLGLGARNLTAGWYPLGTQAKYVMG